MIGAGSIIVLVFCCVQICVVVGCSGGDMCVFSCRAVGILCAGVGVVVFDGRSFVHFVGAGVIGCAGVSIIAGGGIGCV